MRKDPARERGAEQGERGTEQLISQLAGGAIDGRAGGKAVKGADMGNVDNIIAGAVGGVGGAQLPGGLFGVGADAAGGISVRCRAT